MFADDGGVNVWFGSVYEDWAERPSKGATSSRSATAPS